LDHIKEFNFFSQQKEDPDPKNPLDKFLRENWDWIGKLFEKHGLRAINYDVVSTLMFMTEFDPPRDEMPKDISFLVNDIRDSISFKMGGISLDWRFGIGDPFLLRFFTETPFT
jgi:hypothetical protein